MSVTDQGPGAGPAQHQRPVPRRRRIVWRVLGLLAALSIGSAGLSYISALTYPGDATWQARTVEWVRDPGGSGPVTVVENWWYAHNAPAGSAPAPGTVPAADASGAPVAPAAAGPAPLPLLPGRPALPGEGSWVPGGQRAGGTPALYTSWFRSDPAFPSQVVGVAWMNQSVTTAHLIAGTREPVTGGSAARAQVPTGLRSSLVATFNSGWRMKDISGGYYAGGREVVPLRDGAASLVIDTAGRISVGQWGRDVAMGPHVATVRQNLDLVVDQGRPVPGLADNPDGSWGSAKNQFQFTWRSGVGTDAAGNLVYVGGDQLTLSGLASAMVAAGVQRGMELDIHNGMVAFNSYRPSTSDPSGIAGTTLLPNMRQPAIRYLAPDQRDFLAISLRTLAPTG